jgi:hypothetical protein
LGRLVDVTAPTVPFGFSSDQEEVNEQRTAYGLAARGLLVVHDGANTPDVPGDDGERRPNTNLKFLDARFPR